MINTNFVQLDVLGHWLVMRAGQFRKAPFQKDCRKVTVEQKKKQCKRVGFFAKRDYINSKENANILFHSYFLTLLRKVGNNYLAYL